MLAAEGGRPHWGKYYNPDLYSWDRLYPQWSQFSALRDQLDPAGKFSNEHIRRLFQNLDSTPVSCTAG